MGWIAELYGQVVGLDTAPLIYFIERHPGYIDTIRPFFQAVDRGDLSVVTSTVTLLEVLIHPIRRKDESLAYRYNDILLSSPNIITDPLTPTIAQYAAELRAEHSLKAVDAIQLATALSHNAVAFLTNDRDFGNVPGITILRVSDLKT
jgi:predicted nucleic acid-binding protein